MKNLTRMVCCLMGASLALHNNTSRALAVSDDTGATLQLVAMPQRLVSLAPGVTEMLFAAGAGGKVIATVQRSDVPLAARALPRVGDATTVDIERLLAFKPDLIVVWEGVTSAPIVARLGSLHLPIYRVRAVTLADIPASVRRLGMLTGTVTQANTAAQKMEAQVKTLASRTPRQIPIAVFYQIWNAPVYTVSGKHIISDAMARCGARNVFAELGSVAPIVTREWVIQRDPDVMIMSAPILTAREWKAEWYQFSDLRAVRNRQVVNFSNEDLDRMGPTAIDAAAAFCQLLDQVPASAINTKAPKPGLAPTPKP